MTASAAFSAEHCSGVALGLPAGVLDRFDDELPDEGVPEPVAGAGGSVAVGVLEAAPPPVGAGA